VRFSAGELLTYLIIVSIVAVAGGKWFLMENTVDALEAKTVIYETQFEMFGGAVDTLKTDVGQLKIDIGHIRISLTDIAKPMSANSK
jgi:hypothetical protein